LSSYNQLGVGVQISIRVQLNAETEYTGALVLILASNKITCNRGEVHILATPERASASSASYAEC